MTTSRDAERAAQRAVVVMYSGGLDSTLAAALMAERHERVLLATFDVPLTFGVQRSVRNVRALRAAYPDCRIEHHVIDAGAARRRIWAGFAADYFAYCGSQSPGIICMGCKMAMLVESIRLCCREGAANISNGMSGSQSDHPECMPKVVNRFGDLMEEYGIAYVNPVYEILTREAEREMLAARGLDVGVSIGASSVTHQPRCLLGPYSTLWKAAWPLRQDDMVAYFDAKRPLLRTLVEEEGRRGAVKARVKDRVRVDETRGYRHAYEFGKEADAALSLALAPLWWLSRGLLWALRGASGRRGG